MRKFCIIANEDKDKQYQTAGALKGYLEGKGRECGLVSAYEAEGEAEGVRTYTNANEIPLDVECAIVLGGDGTMIQAANDLAYRDIPLLGINLGTLGFLTTVDKEHMFAAMDRVFRGDYKIEKRMMLQGGFGTSTWQALNDFIIGKKDYGRLIHVQVDINGERMDEYVADGVIVSTPTGSTAYNLSAGGPVLAPETRVIVITPICPHSLNKRSLVVSANDLLELEVGPCKSSANDKAVWMADGRKVAELETGDKVNVTVSKENTRIVRLMDVSFYESLRSKL